MQIITEFKEIKFLYVSICIVTYSIPHLMCLELSAAEYSYTNELAF